MNIIYGRDGNVYKTSISNGKEYMSSKKEKEEFAIAKLEKIKAEVEEIRTEEPLMSIEFECYGVKDKTPEDIKTEVIELLDNHISELKGENK